MAELDAWAYAAALAKKSDDDAKKPVEYQRMANVQNPHTYTAAADAAKKSDEDGKKAVKYVVVPSQQ